MKLSKHGSWEIWHSIKPGSLWQTNPTFPATKNISFHKMFFSERLFELPFWNLSLLRYIIYIYTYGSYLFFSSGGNCSLATFLKPSKPASHGKIWRSIERWDYKYLPCYATLKRKPLCSKSSFFRCRFDLVFRFFWKKILLICWHLASLESSFKRHDGMTRFSNHPSPPQPVSDLRKVNCVIPPAH